MTSSAIGSTGMSRCDNCYSSFCSNSTAPMSLMIERSFGNMPKTSAQRFTSLFNVGPFSVATLSHAGIELMSPIVDLVLSVSSVRRPLRQAHCPD